MALNKKWISELQAIAKNNQCQISDIDEGAMRVTFQHSVVGCKQFWINGLTPILVKEWISQSIGLNSLTTQ